MSRAPVQIMDAEEIRQAVARLGGEIFDGLNVDDTVLVLGVQRGGMGMGRRLAGELSSLLDHPVPHGSIDGGMHRDDLDHRHDVHLHPTEIPVAVDDQIVILADDVIASGRTVRAVLDELQNHGRPRAVRLAVLIDRGHRELPIQPDHVARVVEAEDQDRVMVKWLEEHGEDAVHVVPA
jgi:pyrimidine operon attenuation protein/uracil phosphoribosyltransferase